MPLKAPAFGSLEYWDQRFTKNPDAFDWLSTPDSLDSFVTDALDVTDEEEPQILHIGCGSSLLSQHLKKHVRKAWQVHNIDYSEVVIETERKRDQNRSTTDQRQKKDESALMRWNAVDLLNYTSVTEVCDCSAYSVVVDKSTSDAISCADDVVCRLPYALTTRKRTTIEDKRKAETLELPVHPLHVMAVHLALVTKPGARWISLSYSSERYPFLKDEALDIDEDGTAHIGIPNPKLLWTVVGKHQVEAKEKEDGSSSEVTHRPKVYHWVYVLQRTSVPLLFHNK